MRSVQNGGSDEEVEIEEGKKSSSRVPCPWLRGSPAMSERARLALRSPWRSAAEPSTPEQSGGRERTRRIIPTAARRRPVRRPDPAQLGGTIFPLCVRMSRRDSRRSDLGLKRTSS
ncbi:hypothetical protein ZWY2020_045098 [Hordeum vulgare]|nr:hypothetical protein ZWY2020_045098 [Hordeum vulgare]